MSRTSAELRRQYYQKAARKAYDPKTDFSTDDLRLLREWLIAQAQVLNKIPDFDRAVVSIASFLEQKSRNPWVSKKELSKAKPFTAPYSAPRARLS